MKRKKTVTKTITNTGRDEDALFQEITTFIKERFPKSSIVFMVESTDGVYQMFHGTAISQLGMMAVAKAQVIERTNRRSMAEDIRVIAGAFGKKAEVHAS